MMSALMSPEAGQFLSDLWKDVGSRLESKEQCEYPELTHNSTRCGSYIISMIGFPAPEGITEPHFSAFAFGPLQAITPESLATLTARYFVLEKGFANDFVTPRTVFCEWTKERAHLNGGDGPDPSGEAFLDSICQRMSIPLNAAKTKLGS
jgi:hypothetical protein